MVINSGEELKMVLKHRRKSAKVVRKPQKKLGQKIASKLEGSFLKDEWDLSKSPADNLSSFGLNPDPNRTFSSSRDGIGRKTKPRDPSEGTAAFVGMAEIPRDDFRERNDRARVMSEEKQKYASNCIKAHRDDYDKMAMDIKVNFNQSTANQLKKLCEKFVGLKDKDRLIPVPTKGK